MKAARLHEIGKFIIEDVEVPTPTGDQILLKIGASGICGSDLPRVYEIGTSTHRYPLTLGHEFGGEIVSVGENVDKSNIGKHGAIFPCIPCTKCDVCTSGNYAMCLDYDYLGSRSDGGFAEYCLIPSMWHFVEANDSVSYESLAMVEPATVAQHALRKGKLTAGESIIIFGAGPIGIMAARWANIFSAKKVVLVDVDLDKINFAKERGLTCIDGTKKDFYENALSLNDGNPYDLVIEGVGIGITLNQSINLVKTFGRIVLMGNPAKDTTIDMKSHSSILRKEITLQGIWNSHYHNIPLNEWHYTVSQLESGELVLDDLVTHAVEMDDFLEIFEKVYKKEVLSCKVLYRSDLK